MTANTSFIQPIPNLQLAQPSERTNTPHGEAIEQLLISQQLINQLHIKLKLAKIKTLSHKFTARFWKQLDTSINVTSTVLAAISGTSALSSSNPIFAGIFGLAAAVLSAMNSALKPGDITNAHLQTAAKYAALRNEIDLFLSQNSIFEFENQESYRPVKQNDDDFTEEVHQFFQKLMPEFNTLEEKAPITFLWADNRARGLVLRSSPPKPSTEETLPHNS